jgi:hypothetical protein
MTKRGIVLSPADFTWDGWPARVADAGLNYLGIHSSIEDVLSFLRTARGEAVLAEADRLGIAINFEMHIMSELLPRAHFESCPEMFGADDTRRRTPDANPCVSSARALEIIGENARRHAAALREFSDINRYYFWPHDNRPWCRCTSCRGLSFSDQCLVFTNALCGALREAQPDARVAYLAYATALEAPSAVRPAEGVFLQYAPISRCYDRALGDPDCAENRRHVDALRALCRCFGMAEAEVLEYWLDVSRFSGWRKPAVRLPFWPEVFTLDVAFYASLGIRRVSSFGVYIDADYVARHGAPPLAEYGRALGCGS